MGNGAMTDKEMLKEGQGNTPGKKSGVRYIQSGESWVGAGSWNRRQKQRQKPPKMAVISPRQTFYKFKIDLYF